METYKLTVPKVTRAPLASANKTLKLQVPSKRRAVLYAAELRAAQATMRSWGTAGAAPVAGRLRRAISGSRLKDLIESLAHILDDYVAYGVQQDFRVGGVGQNEPDYDAYFSHQIDAGPGVAGFFVRYPLLQDAITTLRTYFVGNILTALTRIDADWNELEQGFLNPGALPGGAGDTLVALHHIQPTGSDFHKRGKQVLILTFAYATPTAPAIGDWRRRASRSERRSVAKRTTNALNTRPYLLKVVYKPSDVEIDCRIMGDTARLATARGGAAGPENPAIGQSLMELFNAQLGRAAGAPDALPTYLVIPHGAGSSVAGNPPGAAYMANCYGYLEFLTHEPAAKVGTGALTDANAAAQVRRGCNAVGGWRGLNCMDWVTSTHAQSQEVFRHWGRLAAIAITFSIADMHVQNVILHKNKPHLIDLEDTIKWRMTSINQTGIFAAPTPSCDNFRGPNPLANAKVYDLQKTLLCGPMPGPQDFSQTVLFTYPLGGAPQRVGKAAMHAEMHAGFDEIFNLLRIAAHNLAVNAWATANLPNVITRFVAMATGDYYNALSNFISKNLGNAALQSPAAAGGAVAYRAQFQNYGGQHYFERQANSARQLWAGINRNQGEEEEKRQWRGGMLPTFCLEHPDANWLDIIQWDIPSFYRRLGTTDLLNSDGAVFHPGTALAWQNAAVTGAGAVAALGPAQAVDVDRNFANKEAARQAAMAAAAGGPVAMAIAAANAVSLVPAATAAAVAAAGHGQPLRLAAQGAAAAIGATPASIADACADAAAAAAQPVRLQHYFPESAVAMVNRQITNLQTAPAVAPLDYNTALGNACKASMH